MRDLYYLSFNLKIDSKSAKFNYAASRRTNPIFSPRNRGIVLVNLKRYEDALYSFDRAVSLNPDDDRAWHNRGIVLAINLKRYEDALQSYGQAVSLNPYDEQTWSRRKYRVRATRGSERLNPIFYKGYSSQSFFCTEIKFYSN